jgi:hypothetical protein
MIRRHHYPGSARALALLTVLPVTDTELPRFHFHLPLADGSVVVEDRAVHVRLVVYTAKTVAQFHGGHRSYLWYVRPVGSDPINRPRSRPFASFADASNAVRSGSWGMATGDADRRPIRVSRDPPK